MGRLLLIIVLVGACESAATVKPLRREVTVVHAGPPRSEPVPALPAIEISDDDLAPILEEGDGLTVEQRWEGTIAELEDRLPRGLGAVHGRVRDAATGEALPGVTVTVARSGDPPAHSAITDENGFYAIVDLLPGEHQAFIYYLEVTLERWIEVEERFAAPMFVNLSPPLRDPIYTQSPDGEGVVFTGITSSENTYVIDNLDEAVTEIEIVGEAIAREPPPPFVDTPEARPGYRWIDGRWEWRTDHWIWTDGHWERDQRAEDVHPPAEELDP